MLEVQQIIMIEGRAGKKCGNKVEETKQQFEQLLNCQICYCKAQHPTFCPHCSKLYCQLCISTSLKLKAQCPNCRKAIKGQLTHCTRFINELTSIVCQIFEGSEQSEKCWEHGINLNYFCLECRKSACCECKMFGEHQSHHFQPISLLYQVKYHQIRQLITQLKTRIALKEQTLTEIENRLIAIKAKAKAQTNLAEIQDYTDKCKTKMMHQSSDQQQYEDAQDLLGELQELSSIKSALLNQLEQAKRVNCFQYSQAVFNRLETLLLNNKNRYQSRKNVSVAEGAIPPFERFKVVIDSYSKRKKEGQPFYSVPVHYEESEWRLVVYLRGNTHPQYVSIFLELLTNPDTTNLYVYQIQLVNSQDQGSNITKQHHSKFNLNQCWGYGKFIKSADLEAHHFLNHDDSLNINFGVRLSNYYDLYARRERRLQKLQGEREGNDEVIRGMQVGKQSVESIEIE